MTVRQVQARRASGNTMRMVMSAKAARKAASCQAVKPHHLMAAPPVEKRTAATTIFERGLMAPRGGSRNLFQTMRFALTAAGLLISAVAGCSSSHATRPSNAAPSRDADVITADELTGTTAPSVYDAVRQLRPAWWMRSQPTVVLRQNQLIVYVDGIRYGGFLRFPQPRKNPPAVLPHYSPRRAPTPIRPRQPPRPDRV